MERGSSNAVVGGVCERGAASCRCQRPSCGGLPKQVKLQRAALLPTFLCHYAPCVSIPLSLCFRRKQRYQSAPRNIHRHVLLSEIKEATSSLPLVRNIQQLHVYTIYGELFSVHFLIDNEGVKVTCRIKNSIICLFSLSKLYSETRGANLNNNHWTKETGQLFALGPSLRLIVIIAIHHTHMQIIV